MGGALFAYTILVLRGRLTGARWLVVGIALILVASMVQAGQTLRFTWIWPFDHNGIFHLLLMPAVICLALGVRASRANHGEEEA